MTLGTPLGASLGERLGTPDGGTLGVELGKSLGETLGTADGDKLGVSLGPMLGASEPTVGLEEGTILGIELGLPEGEPEGMPLGVAEGAPLGISDGDALIATLIAGGALPVACVKSSAMVPASTSASSCFLMVSGSTPAAPACLIHSTRTSQQLEVWVASLQGRMKALTSTCVKDASNLLPATDVASAVKSATTSVSVVPAG